jgi:DNA repair protein RAD16
MQHSCHFNRHILNPIKEYGYVDEGKKAMLKLKNEILDKVLLRRTKTLRADDVQLPPRMVKVRKLCMDSREEDVYSAIYSNSKVRFNTYVNEGTVLNNYANIFEVLMRLRQALDHPYLVLHSDTQHNASLVAISEANVAARRKQQDQQLQEDLVETCCGLCRDPIEDPRRAECGHMFCRSCISDYLDTVMGAAPIGSITSCPVCKEPLSIDLDAVVSVAALEAAEAVLGSDVIDEAGPSSSSSSSSSGGSSGPLLSTGILTSSGLPYRPRKKSILMKVNLEGFQSSSKIEALMQELYKMQQSDLGAKAIVFSQFSNMLDLIEFRINTDKRSSGYDTTFGNQTTSSAVPMRCAILSGSMNIDMRDKIIKVFNTDPTLKVLLISLKAGGVALNLTVASHIFLMDPWWNPAAEYQAIDRTHRFGQHKPIYATRFIMENTIEERILSLQEKKRLVFDGTIGGDAGSMGRLTAEDMGFLFS